MALLAVLTLAGCAREEVLHGLDEPQANEVLVALEEAGLSAEKVRDASAGGSAQQTWQIEVPASQAVRAHRLLAEQSLPRPRPPGLGEVFGQGSLVPTGVEEQARYGHALAGELARTLESMPGVVGARVHLGLPAPDRLGAAGDASRARARAAVLLRCRPAACPGLRALEPGVRSLVAGAAQGLEPEQVSVVIAPAQESPPPQPAPPSRAAIYLGLSSVAALGALGTLAAWVLARLGRRDRP